MDSELKVTSHGALMDSRLKVTPSHGELMGSELEVTSLHGVVNGSTPQEAFDTSSELRVTSLHGALTDSELKLPPRAARARTRGGRSPPRTAWSATPCRKRPSVRTRSRRLPFAWRPHGPGAEGYSLRPREPQSRFAGRVSLNHVSTGRVSLNHDSQAA